ncbi:MAG: adenylyl-sulfate kinase [Alphaproteobacteria bacterium]|nr:adenylyl-sulfate kinase [Alphaproteobacteria bacterium]
MVAARETLRIVIVGHVDHGKSTLIGRLLHDTGSLPEGKQAAIQEASQRRGVAFEWAFLLDALQAERDQGVTIDTARIWFQTTRRDYVIIDAPGHREFLKNMITGAAGADAAILVIDADEGIRDQTQRHAYVLHLLGVRQICVAVNKMDRVGYDQKRFLAIDGAIRRYLADIGLDASFVIPVAARDGVNVVHRAMMPWYDGPTLVEAVDHFRAPEPLDGRPLRLPLQDVYKFDERRILVGRIAYGTVRPGDTLLFSPSNKTAKVASIEAWGATQRPSEASAGQSVGLTLDEPIFVERGEIASHTTDPPIETDVFRARVFWLGVNPLLVGARYALKIATATYPVRIQAIERVIDTTDLRPRPAAAAVCNDIVEVVIRSDRLLAADPAADLPHTGRFALVEGHRLVGGGLLSMSGYADQRQLSTVRATNVSRVEHGVSQADRLRRNGHAGGVVWLTGLSGAGKSTLAVELERRLFGLGYQVYVLDGDNLRHGLNADLGFAPEDRAENIRRAGEVAALLARAGFVVISSFISPYRSDRERARRAAGTDFFEVFVKADLATCERRDPKGLYRRARAGQIPQFTGVSAPYEEPEHPDLVVDTVEQNVGRCADDLLGFVESKFRLASSAPSR